jgi:hypothetical protein
MKGFNPTHYVMAGDRLLACILPIGNGSPKAPRRFLVYWESDPYQLRAPMIECPTARDAIAAAMTWAREHFDNVRTERRTR